jgi:hypothetical protein
MAAGKYTVPVQAVILAIKLFRYEPVFLSVAGRSSNQWLSGRRM